LSVFDGKTVLVTRPKGQGSTFLDELATRGANAIILSTTEVALPEDTEPMDRALRHLDDFDWVVFTSTNGVKATKDRLEALGLPLDSMAKPRIAVVGPSTAGAVSQFWKAPDCQPDVFTSWHIADAIGELTRKSVLLLRGDLASTSLPDALAQRGAIVVDAVAYRLVRSEVGSLGDAVIVPDVIAVTSGENAISAIQALQLMGFEHWLRDIPIVCIGPNTADAVKKHGFRPACIANPHSAAGLIAAVERVLGDAVCAAT